MENKARSVLRVGGWATGLCITPLFSGSGLALLPRLLSVTLGRPDRVSTAMMILAGPARAMVAKFALIATLVLLAVPFHALAQRGKSPRIGYLAGSRAEGSAHLVAALRDGLRERGWTPGQNITIEFRFAEGQ